MKETLIGHQTLHRVRERLVDADNEINFFGTDRPRIQFLLLFLKSFLCKVGPFSHVLSHLSQYSYSIMCSSRLNYCMIIEVVKYLGT